jgi:PAS domain S-box-containing protein
MEAGKKALKCLIISNSQTFLREISKNLNSYKSIFEIRSSNNPSNIKNLIFYQDLAIIEDDYIHQTAENVLVDLMSFLFASQIRVILLNDFKKKLPEYIARRTDFVRIISKSASNYEFNFVLDEIEYQIRNSGEGIKSSHDKYLEAIIQIQNLLLNKMPLESKVKEVLRLVGITAGATRVALFENKYDHKGKFLMTLRFEWLNTRHASESEHPLFKVMPYHPNFNRWGSSLSAGKVISGFAHKFPASEQSLLKTIGIRNLLLLPIIIKGEFWGFVMAAVTRQQKLWEREELPYLKSIITPITSYLELKQEENKKDRKDDLMERVFKDSNVGLFIANREGNIKSCNKAFSSMIGYGDASNQNVKVFSHPDDFQKEIPHLKKLLSGEVHSYFIEKRLLSKGGKQIWTKMNVSAYSKQDSRPDLIIGLVENITAQKVAERALKDSENRHKMLSELSNEGIVLHRQGIAVDCNERILEMSGYSRDELIGKNLVDLLADNRSKELVKTKIKNDDLHPYLALGITKKGIKIPVEIENRIIEYHGEKLRITAFRDVTERKRSEQELRKLNIAINKSPSSIVITDKNGCIEYVNQSFCEISGYSMEEAIGRNPSVLKSDYHSSAYYQNLWATIGKGETWHGVFKNKAKDGSFFWERAVISPIFDEQKNITHFLAIKENITTEKETREALEESEERHRVIAELTNDFVYSAIIRNNKITINWKSGSLKKLAGYELHEINEKAIGWYSIIDDEDLEKVLFPAIINLPRQKTQNVEYRITTRDNKEKWVSDKLRLISDEQDSEKLVVIGAIQDITLRKSASIALDQSKRYLDSIIDNLPIGLQIFDEGGFSTRINESQRKLLGVKKPDGNVGKFNILNDPRSIITGADKLYREVYEKKTTINRELEVDKESGVDEKSGKKVTINEIIFPIVKNDGKVHSVISLSNDITKRVEAEKALKASEMHQKALLKVIPDLIFVFSEDGIFRDVYTEDNNRLLVPSGDFLNKSFSEVFPDELSDIFYKNLQNAVESREMQSFNYEMTANDRTQYYETRLLVSKEKEVIAIIRDITDNTLAEKSVKDSEEKFRELAERTQDTLILLSASNEILYISPNLERIMGISADEYAENPLHVLKLVHPEDRYWVIPEINNYRKKQHESIDIQFRVVLESGDLKWIWYRENTIFDQNHHPLRYAAVMTDITSNKLAEQQLKEAKEEAEKAYRSKSVFLANISHEIRTPMNAVLGFTDLLYSRITDPVLKGYLSSIRSSGNTLLNLLNDILDLSKIEAEKMRIILSPVNLFTVFDEIKHIFSLKALEKGLDYSFKIDKNIPSSLMLDELRLKQILLNLIDNAIKFTEQGEIKIKARLIGSQSFDSKVDISIAVEDSGIGIPESMQESVFESFRQQDDQDKKKYKGTGLGLAITKRLVELCKGSLKLTSKPGMGSKFEVVFTDLEVSEPIITLEKRSSRKIRFEKAALKNKVIVLVDEQKTNRDLIKEVFYQSESKVIEGESVESVLDEVTEDVDLFILEMKNPGSVLEDLILINNHPGLKNSAMIGVTSTSEFNLETKILKAFKAILTKPIQLEGFVEIVDNHFSRSGNKEKKNGSVFDDDIIDFSILNEVIKLLKGDLHQQWQSALDTASFAEIEQFAQTIKEVGTEYNLHALNTFSDVLTMHVKNFDIDRMNEVLNSYPVIIKELKGNLKNLTSDN